MRYLKIQNDGQLDIRLVALMGGTTKANNKYKIGQFGTGLKYTLAYLFRNNIDFKIFDGENPFPVDLKTETERIKDSDFEIICIDGKRTSITTGMGREWSAWMIIRELWCNALDEGGALKEVVTNDKPFEAEPGKTTFYIQLTSEFQQVLDEWSSYFIHQEEPLWENDEYAIYKNRDKKKLKLYKHGVLIYQHPNHNSLFYYDVKGAEINELREFKGSVSFEIFNSLREPNEEVISYFLTKITDEYFEGCELDYGWYTSFANVWRDHIGDRRLAHGGSSYYEGEGIDMSNIIQLPKRVYQALTKDFEGIGVFTMADDETEFYEIPNAKIKERVAACVQRLAEVGYQIDPEAKFRYGVFEKSDRKAAAKRKKKQILISENCLKISDELLTVVIVENVEYLNLDCKKDNPKFYQHFVGLYTNILLAGQPVEI
jgi:hypothetical protein